MSYADELEVLLDDWAVKKAELRRQKLLLLRDFLLCVAGCWVVLWVCLRWVVP